MRRLARPRVLAYVLDSTSRLQCSVCIYWLFLESEIQDWLLYIGECGTSKMLFMDIYHSLLEKIPHIIRLIELAGRRVVYRTISSAEFVFQRLQCWVLHMVS
jgi:hypothetical protein